MSEQRKGPLWDVLRLAAEGAPTQEFLAKAVLAKEDIVRSIRNLCRDVSILDNIVAHIAPDAHWVGGVVGLSPPAAGPVPHRQIARDRKRRTLEIAESMLADGTNRVNTKAVAEALRREGFQDSVHMLTISAGNTLAHTHVWRRIEPCEYERIE
ncbi:MAG: hypothetical protein ACE5IA_01805 [Dehalococcoidia bacterium]